MNLINILQELTLVLALRMLSLMLVRGLQTFALALGLCANVLIKSQVLNFLSELLLVVLSID